LSNNVTVVNAVNNTVITSIPVTGNSPVAMGRFMGPAPAPAKTVKVSLGNNGKGLDGDSYQASISADGRFVVFGYANRIYLRDRATRTLSRIDGRYDLATGEWHWGNDVSSNPVISPNGRYVAYQSEAWNLDPDGLDNNGLSDIFRYDRITREIKTISKHRGGLGTATGESIAPSVSNDGGVAFASNATDLVPSGEKTTRAWDVFVGWGASVQRVSTASAPANTEGNGDALQPAISASGQFVTFISSSSNLVAGDTNNAWDVFVRDRGANTTTRVSIATGAAGAQGNLDSWQPAISGDGRYVAFASDATNLVTPDLNDVADIFVRDRTQNKTYLVSVDARGAQGDGPSYSPAISPDGRYVAFESYAALDPLDFNEVADIYLRDRTAKQTSRLSVSTRGVEGNGDSLRPSMSADGRHVAFDSLANNLVSGDYFGEESNWDIFVRDRGVGTTPAYPASAPLEPQPIK
jgi:Tol biopolymer transport system component